MTQLSTQAAQKISANSISISPLTPCIGAEVGNVDLRQPVSDATFKQIHDALMAHGVIFFRDQKLEPLHLRDFSACFGKLLVHPFMPAVDGVSEITVFENDRERPAAVNFWHSDLTSLKKPPMGAVLYAHIIPPTGGDTLWSNMYAAFDALSDSMKKFLTSLVAVHAVDPADYGKALGDKVKIAQTGVRSAEHPVVRTHPVTGRMSLFVNAGSTKSIKDMKASESDALLQMLFRHVELPEFQVRFRWQQHSIAIWDNRCTQHYAVADYWPHRRVMYRAAIDGDAPY